MMTPLKRILTTAAICFGSTVPVLMTGCAKDRCACKCEEGCPPRPAQFPPLGHLTDPYWQRQERNAEASDFVVHEHEFEGNAARLNNLGESHVRQIAARVGSVPFKVLVEPSSMKPLENTQFGYPIHPDPELDKKRRKVIVQALLAMGVQDAEERVVISPALAPGFEQFEGERSYMQGFSGSQNGNGSGFGGFGGGLGGFGGFGSGAGFF